MSSSGTALNNKSGHTALTSTCRALCSTANICNEKLIVGNRLFNSYQRTLENMLSLLSVTDFAKMEATVVKYGMRHAETHEVMDMVRRCSARYWNDENRMLDIEEFVKRLRPVERTAILCNMDLEGLRTTNKPVLYAFLSDFIQIPDLPPTANEKDYDKPDNGDRKVLCISKIMKSSTSATEINYLNHYHLGVEEKWKDFIETFLKSAIPSSGVYDIRDMIREVVQTSDTDSSIYTVDPF